jgi:hypothetical protein
VYPRFSPWWTPWGFALRLPRILRSPGDLIWLIRIGWFVTRLPGDVERTHLADFLARLRSRARPSAPNPTTAVERVVRLRSPWLHLPWLRAHDTCYVRALTLYRFVDAPGRELRLRVGAEWFDQPGGVLRGHAWVTLDGATVEEPPGVDDHGRLQPIELLPREA